MPARPATRADVVAAAVRLAALGRTAWLGIDGFGAAGKTSLAAGVAAAVPGTRVVHVDDFPLPPEWDWTRFEHEVAGPLRTGRPARYRVGDGAGGDVEVPPGGLVVVEGVSSTRAEVRVPWDLTVWVDAPREVRLARARERDGAALLTRWLEDWMPSEERYAARENPRERVDLLVPGV